MTATDTAGLESVLAAVHAAIYGYSQAGAALVLLQSPVPLLAATRGGYDALRTSRDQLADAIAAAGGPAVEPLPGYALPFPLKDPAAVVRLLTGIEDRLSAIAATATASSTGRLLMADVLSASAVRALQLRLLAGSPPSKAVAALPGMPG